MTADELKRMAAAKALTMVTSGMRLGLGTGSTAKHLVDLLGAQVRDGVKSVVTLGAPPEADWPYDIARFAKAPPARAFADAKLDLVSTYARVAQSLGQMQGCLAEGFPFVDSAPKPMLVLAKDPVRQSVSSALRINSVDPS